MTAAFEYTQLPRWRTREFFVYYAIIAMAFITGIPKLLEMCSSSHPNYHLYKGDLSKGWLLGRMMDNSDYQWRSFRGAIPIAALLMFANFTAHKFIQHRKLPVWESRLVVCLLGLFLLHGFNSIKILTLLSISFGIGKSTRGSILNPAITWVFAMGTLFFLEWAKGKSFFTTSIYLWAGFQPRWHVTFNITILRLISFNMDLYFSERRSYSLMEHIESCKDCSSSSLTEGSLTDCIKRRIQEPASKYSFSVVHFLSYCLYLPLYFAGPIITFNDFVSQVNRPIKQKRQDIVIYGLRWLACWLTMELLMHTVYVVAIKNNSAWYGFTPLQFALLGFFNLKLVWLKLLLIWRFFRFFSMMDGIVPGENMGRCMSNNYSMQGFWRSWHRTYNQFIIRYIYIPLGGSQYGWLSCWPIFTFVAIWHDVRLNLLAWSWLVCLFLMPEFLLNWADKRFRLSQTLPGYHWWCAFAGAINVFCMCTANLVGFVTGVNGTEALLSSFISKDGLLFIPIMFVILFAAVNIMFEIRAQEKRQGIYKNY